MSAAVQDLIVVDCGNTRIKFARFEDRGGNALPQLCEFAAPLCGAVIDWDELRGWPFQSRPVPGYVSGSNPPEVARVLREWPADWQPPIEKCDRRELSIPLLVDFPDRVGMDRALNAVAARALLSAGQSAVIVDSGTTVTVDVVSEAGFHGGAILPGFELSAKALTEYTALLPLIEHHRLYDSTPPSIGRNTEAALSSGLYWGHVGAVKELVARESEELRAGSTTPFPPPLLILTGGAARLLMPYLPGARFEPMLALQGLAHLAFREAA